MFQTIKKFFSLEKRDSKKKGKESKNAWAEKPDFAKGYDGARQIREMAKLGGKLVL